MRAESQVVRGQWQTLLDFLHALKLGALPPRVLAGARGCLLDALGCGLFGARQPWSRIMAEEAYAERARGVASVLGQAETTAATLAARCNGTAMHGFELDDLLDEAIVHPGAVIVPAALAAAEATGASGARLLLGILAGYEVGNRVGLALGVEPARKGFHKTTLAGPVAAAIAAGIVIGLSREQLAAAAGLACSAASGIKSFAAGSGGGMMKRMHAGRAAEAGVRMAQLAARNFTGPPTAVDGRFGLLEVFAGESAAPARLSARLGEAWATDDVFVKVYPVCSWIQSTVQQLVALRGERALDANAIARVRIGVSAYAIRSNGEPAPIDTMGAQYSIPYCAALALTANPSDPAQYDDAAVAEPARRALARRVELHVDAEMEAAYPKHYGARVELEVTGSGRRESRVLDPHGMPADPCSDAERLQKFARLAGAALAPDRVEAVSQTVQRCEQLASVRELTALLKEAR